MLEELKKIKSGKKDLRAFGYSVGTFLIFLGAFLLWRHSPSYTYFMAAGLLLTALGLVAPRLLKLPHRAWMSLAVLMGWFMTRLILIVLFFIVLTPIALILRLSGKRFLDLKSDCRASCWEHRAERAGGADYEKQF